QWHQFTIARSLQQCPQENAHAPQRSPSETMEQHSSSMVKSDHHLPGLPAGAENAKHDKHSSQ
ncbi:hypothetical protein ACZ87_02638, partial [Candidatus Erwinia dacicola]